MTHSVQHMPEWITLTRVIHIDEHGARTFDKKLGVRAETGPMKFGQDWTGVFIRGDNALMYASALEHLIKRSKDLTGVNWASESVVAGLRDLLHSCSEGDTGWPPQVADRTP